MIINIYWWYIDSDLSEILASNMLRCRLCQEGPQLDFGFGTVDLPAIHRAGSRDDQPLGLRGWTMVTKEWLNCFFLHHKKLNANLYNFRGCEIWNPLLFMQGCESALRSSRAHWKAHLWTQVLIGVSHLWGIQKGDWNHRNETELFSNYYKNILKFVNILSSFLTKSDLQMTSISWQTTLMLTGRFGAAKLYGILASSLHTLELLASMWIKQKRGTGVACDWELVRLMNWWTNSWKIEWKSLPCLIQTKCTVELSPNDLTDFVLESEHLKILSQKMPKSKATNLQWWPRPPLQLAGFWEPWRLSMWRKKLPQIPTNKASMTFTFCFQIDMCYLSASPTFCCFTIRMHFSFPQRTPCLLWISSDSVVNPTSNDDFLDSLAFPWAQARRSWGICGLREWWRKGCA